MDYEMVTGWFFQKFTPNTTILGLPDLPDLKRSLRVNPKMALS
jgi:hypothetical protein